MPPARRRPRGQINQLPSGSWRAVGYAGKDPLTGKERRLKETAKTYEKIALTTLQRQVDEDNHPKTAITVRQAIDQWLEVADLQATTRERYEDLIRIYITPTFGDLAASKLDAELLERFYARLQRCRQLCSGRAGRGHTCRPLSSSTAPSPRQTEPDRPTVEEAARLLAEAWAIEPDWGLLLWLTTVSGCRRGPPHGHRRAPLASFPGPAMEYSPTECPADSVESTMEPPTDRRLLLVAAQDGAAFDPPGA